MDIEGLPKSSLIINQYLKSVKDVTKILLTLPNLIKIKFLGFIFHTKNGCITKNVCNSTHFLVRPSHLTCHQ